jgi:hypothetical protein
MVAIGFPYSFQEYPTTLKPISLLAEQRNWSEKGLCTLPPPVVTKGGAGSTFFLLFLQIILALYKVIKIKYNEMYDKAFL